MADNEESAKFEMTTVKVPSVTPNWNLDVWKYVPAGASSSKPVPVIVIAHGLGATKGMGLGVYAERFASLGYGCAVFDYRCWGLSDGEPRNIHSNEMKHDDYRTVVKWARQQVEFDPHRVVLWGSSFAGGHVLSISGEPRVSPFATIAQCPYLGATDAAKPALNLAFAKQVGLAVLDAVRQFFGYSPIYIPCASPPGGLGLMQGDGYVEEIKELEWVSGSFTNFISASTLFQIPFYSPRDTAKKTRIACPLLIVAPTADVLCHIDYARDVINASDQGELVEVKDAEHFEIYPRKKRFEESINAEIAFLKKHVPV
ncbi:hypothetical protein EWM64_g4762 [Hericium alpestre]|uniref:Serine aminopeptidase S33 domain-containing protein n=1 Tax=Hericium alpestre TaxID=135208 RepID=A0A4Z0A0D9_9AGAM|nr:hypothetical protein EWM64_g4762 [Hericium alpestre]